MEKVFKIMELDCANCAAKMERAIGKIKGVEEVTVNFMTQKAFISAKEEDFEKIVIEADKKIKKIDKNTKIISI